jgi:hypothetical protein
MDGIVRPNGMDGPNDAIGSLPGSQRPSPFESLVMAALMLAGFMSSGWVLWRVFGGLIRLRLP